MNQILRSTAKVSFTRNTDLVSKRFLGALTQKKWDELNQFERMGVALKAMNLESAPKQSIISGETLNHNFQQASDPTFSDVEIFEAFTDEAYSAMNRNNRKPKRANKGKRPCSRSSRRWKKEQIGKRRR